MKKLLYLTAKEEILLSAKQTLFEVEVIHREASNRDEVCPKQD